MSTTDRFVNSAGASRPVGLWLVAAIAILWFGVVPAQDADSGFFEIRQSEMEQRNGTYFLDAYADLRLSAQARDALASGLPLSIIYELEFLNRLRLWWDMEEFTVRQRFLIRYHALTERYLVTNINTAEQAPFPTLEAALAYVGRVDSLPLIESAQLDADHRYDVRLRVILDTERLPGPLRLIAFWRRDWALASEWRTWRLDEE